MRRRFFHAALAFFGIAAAFGAAFAVFGPVWLIRVLGLFALAFAALGCAVQLYALRTFAPEAYSALRERLAGFRGRMSETLSVPAPATATRAA